MPIFSLFSFYVSQPSKWNVSPLTTLQTANWFFHQAMNFCMFSLCPQIRKSLVTFPTISDILSCLSLRINSVLSPKTLCSPASLKIHVSTVFFHWRPTSTTTTTEQKLQDEPQYAANETDNLCRFNGFRTCISLFMGPLCRYATLMPAIATLMPRNVTIDGPSLILPNCAVPESFLMESFSSSVFPCGTMREFTSPSPSFELLWLHDAGGNDVIVVKEITFMHCLECAHPDRLILSHELLLSCIWRSKF